MYESYVKRMSFSSGTGGGLGGFQLICTAGCLSLITWTQERPFSIASKKSPYLPSSQSVSVRGKNLFQDCVKESSVADNVSNYRVHILIFLPMTFFIDPISDQQLIVTSACQRSLMQFSFVCDWINCINVLLIFDISKRDLGNFP